MQLWGQMGVMQHSNWEGGLMFSMEFVWSVTEYQQL
jgi:hypothetical protein